MGLFGIGKDVNSTVTLEYKANVEQAKAALRDLSGEQKKNAQAAVQGLEDQVKAHERLASKITLGIGIAAGAVALGIQGFKQYEEASRLSAASAGADMDRLRSASHGLLTDMELMGIAAVGMNGKFKLTSEELETVLGAAVTLERRGLGPLAEITAKLGEAIKKGEVDPLKELGIVYDEQLAKTDKRRAAMQALTQLSHEAADGTESETDAIRRHGVEFGNAVDRIQEAIGRLVVAFSPLIDVFSGIAARISDIADGLSRIPEIKLPGGVTVGGVAKTVGQAANPLGYTLAAGRFIKAGFSDTESDGVDYLKAVAMQAGFRLTPYVDPEAGNEGQTTSIAGLDFFTPFKPRSGTVAGSLFKGPKKKPGAKFAGSEGGLFDLARMVANRLRADGVLADANRWEQANNAAILSSGEELVGMITDLIKDPFGTADNGYAADSAVGAMGTGRMGVRLKEGPSFMERMLGPVSEIDRYATAWGTFTDAATAGYMALVDGSESAGAAMRRVIAQSVAAEGSRMLVLALREGAEAVAAIARGNFAAAGSHALAAAKFGAGAAIAGVVANQLGGGGSAGASAGAGATSPTGVTAGATEGGPITRNYIIGDSFGFETPRSQAARFANAERRTRMYEAPTAGVEYA